MKPTLASQAATRTEEDTDHRTRVGRERRERTQARIIEAALRVFAEKGPDAPIIDDFIKAAGVARGTFYNYYQSTEELLEATAKWLQDDLIVSIEAEIGSLGRSGRAPEFGHPVVVAQGTHRRRLVRIQRAGAPPWRPGRTTAWRRPESGARGGCVDLLRCRGRARPGGGCLARSHVPHDGGAGIRHLPARHHAAHPAGPGPGCAQCRRGPRPPFAALAPRRADPRLRPGQGGEEAAPRWAERIATC
jgi:AcrR family transcriptional regulator